MVEFVPCKHETSVRFRLLPMEEHFLKDTRASTLVAQSEIDKLMLRFLLKRSYLLHSQIQTEDAFLVRLTIQKLLNSYSRDSSSPRIMDRSPFTGRKRGYYRYAKMSRMEFKKHAGTGALPGFRKSS